MNTPTYPLPPLSPESITTLLLAQSYITGRKEVALERIKINITFEKVVLFNSIMTNLAKLQEMVTAASTDFLTMRIIGFAIDYSMPLLTPR
jgi:hypothetical protein